MKIAWIAIAALFAVGIGTLAWFVAQPAEAADPGPEQIAEVKIVDPTYQPAKPACASCGDARHPTAPLNKEEYEALIKQYALEPIDQSDALDALCYYGVQTRVMMDQYGVGELDEGREAFLREEISRTHVIMSVRVTDENGVVRVSFDERRIPLDYRGHHAVDKAVDVTPPEISGTIKRVGLHHIWSRF